MTALAHPRDQDPGFRDTIEEMRTDTLRSLLYVTVIGTLLWYLWERLKTPTMLAPDRGLFVLPVFIIEAITYYLLNKHRRLAVGVYLVGATLLISTGIILFGAPTATFLYSLLALAAVVVSGPAVGFATASLGTVAVYYVLGMLGRAAPVSEIVPIALASFSTVLISWTLSSNFFLAVRWSLASYEKARESLDAVQQRRAEVIHLNQDLNRARDQLEHANAALLRAWRAAEEAERRQQQITAFISHELRTPLNLVIGFSEMLVTSPETYGLEQLPPKARRDLNAIYRSAQHVGALVDDVLDMTTVDQGRLPLLREPSDIWQVIVEATSMIRDYADTKSLRLELIQEGELPILAMDRLRIRQVLLNLLVNAARFTSEGSIIVKAQSNQGHVRVEVSDTGRGIAPDQLGAIFREFHSTETSNPGWSKGTGLGLPLSRQLVRLHGGEMEVHSELGKGSTFWFTLPCDEYSQGTRPMTSTWTAAAMHRPGGEPTIVVLTEDELAVRRLQRWLESYHLVRVDTWDEAANQAQQHMAMALFADESVAIPVHPPNLPVIRCPLPTGRRWAARLGTAAYLEKPVTHVRLLSTLRAVAPDANRVLVVDDDERFVQLITRMLENDAHSYQVQIALNGCEGLQRMREQQPDILLLDLALPGMDGHQVLQQMAQEGELASIPVVVVSAPPADRGSLPASDTLVVTHPGGLEVSQLIRLLRGLLCAFTPQLEVDRPSDPGPRKDPAA